MDATSDLLRSLNRGWWAILKWGGAILFPFVVFLALRVGPTDPVGWPHLRYLLPILVVVLPLGLLRTWPLPALTLMVAGSFTVVATLQSPESGYLMDIRFIQFLTIDLAVGIIAATRSRRVSIAAALIALVGQAYAEALQPLGALGLPSRRVVFALMLVTTWVIGALVSERRKQAEALRVQTAAAAVIAERLRIARELHDMVAHSIGIIAIQAGVGSRVIDTQPAEARKALTAIETTSRETLSGLRRMLVALRKADPGAKSHSPPLDPVPGLADIDRLAGPATDAGVHIDLQWKGMRRPLPPEIDLSAFRIVQEAVTNVLRHAGTRECRVIIDYRQDALHLDVIDDGRSDAVADTGYGIVGMRERVSLLHGQFTAGPRPGGGFRVTAQLPLPLPAGGR